MIDTTSKNLEEVFSEKHNRPYGYQDSCTIFQWYVPYIVLC